ncbi:MAG: type VI secretion system tip protein VgrG, partial [Planctomycetaceae bacterium]|nr:type VI secretion system tip protein VgrG [Planctomycetaceae bacterium]
MALKQANRFLQISPPIGEDQIFLIGFRGREELSRLFRFELDLISDNPGIAPSSLVGKPVTFSTATIDDGPRRYFHGVINRFFVGDLDREDRRNYRAEVVPWLWFLTRTSDCRIFQNMTSPQIIQKIFDDLGFSDYSPRLKGKYRQREYCVQYRETDFNFVSRLMEEDGIYYYFQHENGKHTLVMADDAGGYFACDQAEIDLPDDATSIAIKEHLTSWEHRFEFRSGKWAQTDYNFETPRTALMTNSNSIVPFQESSKFEFYDYPGDYLTRGDGTPLTDIRMQEEETGHDIVQSSSTCYFLTPGCKFKIGYHPDAAEKGKSYAVTSIIHHASEPLAYETGGGGSAADYSNAFQCIPESTKFRAARLTPKPVVHGIQTAVVVGPKGEEIYCDKYGRIKVQFYWDREGTKDENSSCWMRVAHPHAGREWGNVSIPRIGQEVIVDFLEGDPDRPLIIGSVYNADQMPHYSLPEHKTRTYLKTNSSKKGDGYNELMFEDLRDSERVFVHAQKDMDVRVRNDSKTRISGNKHQIVGWEKNGSKGGSQHELVWEDRHTKIKRHEIAHIEGNVELAVGMGNA